MAENVNPKNDLELDLPQCVKLMGAESARPSTRIVGALAGASLLMHQLTDDDADVLETIRQLLDHANDTFISKVGDVR